MNRYNKLQGVTERLREAVKASGLTPREIQQRVGIKKSTYYDHINGARLTELNIAKYCIVLKISADWLLGLKGDNRPENLKVFTIQSEHMREGHPRTKGGG